MKNNTDLKYIGKKIAKEHYLRRIWLGIFFCAFTVSAFSGPPYVTDDPEPVEYRHWEVYFASQSEHDHEGWSGTAPHIEINYGAIPNLQLHLISPTAYVVPKQGKSHYGYGDTELGLKYRFVQESDKIPMVGVFPLVEIPSGNNEEGLGNGHTQFFLPIWFQKSAGPWTTYGGGGYWINPGSGNRNYTLIGWLIQRQITDQITPGIEIFHTTPQTDDGHSETRINIGLVVDFNDLSHLLFSAGHTVQGPSAFQGYIAYQLTFGPEKQP